MSVSKARRNRIKEVWTGLPESWRTLLKSAVDTFIAAFLLEVIEVINTGDFSLTRATLRALLIAALRAGVKASTTATITQILPDPKNN